MKSWTRSAALALATVLAASCMISVSAFAGGEGFGDDDDNSAEDGPSYFGFVRDAAGATVPDAKVVVSLKNRVSVVTRTDALGTYKVPGFGKEVDPKEVEVACSKDGYQQRRVVRRSLPSADPKIPIETECTLQRNVQQRR
jgi:Carboxypeptidase regulatory-like domain